MKRIVVSICAVICASFLLSFAAAIPARAQSHELMQGTEVHLRLLNGLSTSVAHPGDPFIAEVTQPVMFGSQLILPAGARVRGTVGGIIHTRHFPLIRGQAAMNLSFRELELDSRLFPLRMSIISLESPAAEDKEGKTRGDVKIEEGQVIQSKYDVKRDVIAGAIGTGGGTLVGAVFSNATRGLGIGLAGSAFYILQRKGREVELPAQTTLVVRMDSTITLPKLSAEYNSSEPGKTAREQ